MEFHLRPMRWRDLPTIARWHYPGEYTVYDMGLAELVAVMLQQFIVSPVFGRIYHTVTDERGQIVGIFSFFRPPDRPLEIGLGLRPDLTGLKQGLGLSFVRAGMAYGWEHFHPNQLRLTVFSWNLRAIRVYQAAGFRVTGGTPGALGGKVEMICTEREP